MQEAGKSAGIDVEAVVPDYRHQAHVHTAELSQAQVKDIHIRLGIKVVDTTGCTQAIANRTFTMYLGNNSPLGATNQDLYGYHYTGGPSNRYNCSSPRLDKLIDQQAGLSK